VEGVVTASKMLVSSVQNTIEAVTVAQVRRATQTHALALGMLNSPISIIDYPSLGAYVTV
jgi:hypothetical protein